MLDAIPQEGEMYYECWKKMDGTRTECDSGLCCGEATVKDDAGSIRRELCYTQN